MPPPLPLPSSEPPALAPQRAWRVDELRNLARALIRSRRTERRVSDLYRLGEITGGCYLGIGNEATSVGAAWPLREHDVLVPTQRDMGAHLVRGHTVLDVMRQYLKRDTSQTRGRDAGLHLGREGSNVVGMISHLGHMMAVAGGIALAERMKGNDVVVMTTIGDGATSLGDFHEAINFAAVQKLPVLFVIENNQYAYSTPVSLQYACSKLSDRGAGYGIPGVQVDGTDVFAVTQAAEAAYARGRAGEGPTLMECVTMRMRGHSEHDDFKYVPADLIEAWNRWDPLERLKNYALQQGLTTADWAELERSVDEEIEAAFQQAKAEPNPPGSSAVQGTFRQWQGSWDAPARENER